MCDLDGVIYRGDEPVGGAADAVSALRGSGIRIVFCTNNSRSTVSQYVEKLAAVGLDVAPAEIVTSAVVTAEVLVAEGFAGARAFVVGGDGIRSCLAEAEIVIDDSHGEPPALVVVGWDPTFSYDEMRRAVLAVRAGARLVATNDDASFPAPDGLWPGAGAILASIETASDVSAEVMGKPHPPMMETVARRLDGAKDIAMVGDRPDTDLAGGAALGWRTILVLSGVTTEAEAATVTPRPDLVLPSLADLPPLVIAS